MQPCCEILNLMLVIRRKLKVKLLLLKCHKLLVLSGQKMSCPRTLYGKKHCLGAKKNIYMTQTVINITGLILSKISRVLQ